MINSDSRTFVVMAFVLFAAYCFTTVTALASQSIADQYPASILYSKPVEVIPGVWTATGATAPPDYDNSGHNNNLSFIVTGDGVVVINSGASYLLAKSFHEEIRKVTDQPVKCVILENGQGHAALGNGYWVEQKVPILAHAEAAKYFDKTGHESLQRMKRYNKEKSAGTLVVAPTDLFTDKRVIELGAFRIEALWLGNAHSPGDIVVWLPQQRLVISGDLAFHERLLPVGENTAEWLATWENFEALKPLYVIPGHGHPTNLDQVRRYTKDYLVHIRTAIGELIEDGGDLQMAYDIDQQTFAHLDTFAELAKINAGKVFEQMEFE